MGDLIKSVTNGVLEQTKNVTQKSSNNELGKEAFLQLLVTQMKYQDPLQPNTDTQYIAQLATFSQLEQMQNISTLTSKSQALGLVGKSVIVKNEGQNGNVSYVTGRVDFVNMSGNKIQLSVNGQLYSLDKVDSVIDDTYIIEQGLPNIDKPMTTDYDLSNPKDISFKVFMGEGQTIANDVAIIIGTNIIDNQYVTVSGNTVTIKKEAFADYPIGNYKISVAFNDALLTVVRDKVTLNISKSNNSDSANSESENKDDDTDDTGVENII